MTLRSLPAATRITVVGATGRTGRRLVPQALDRGHGVVAFARSREKLPVDGPAPSVVEGDVYAGDGVRGAVEGADPSCPSSARPTTDRTTC